MSDISSMHKLDFLPRLPLFQRALQTPPIIQPDTLPLRAFNIFVYKRLPQSLLRLLDPSSILLHQFLTLLVRPRVLERLLRVHHLNQRPLIRQTPMQRIIFIRHVNPVSLQQQISSTQERVRERSVRDVEERRQRDGVLMRGSARGVFVGMVFRLEREEFAA